MKKKYSIYVFENLKYSYNYEKKQVLLTLTGSALLYSDFQKLIKNNFVNYFNTTYIKFNNMKDFKEALYNLSNSMNTEIKFKHIATVYLTDKYRIKKTNNNLWLISYTKNVKYKNHYCKITTSLYNNNLYFYINNEALNKIKTKLENYKDFRTNLIKDHYPYYDKNFPYSLKVTANTRQKTIKNLENLEKLLEIKV